ncbi:c-type cytochrome [Microvirga alba]|uniref:Cytochrome c n=1 Tax=Microvirga alba TaxID=2791025 RepID=A0A931BQ91_9HYPH|nr:cytochrome c [Microvirga alba]MBF9235456.1 cytochrome c [Microvirga alba]
MRVLRVFVGLLLVGLIGAGSLLTWLAAFPSIDPIQPLARSTFSPELIKKGEVLAAFGNCAGCHTKVGGEAYSGGLSLPTPFGVIYSTNITPDPETGIGRWSEAAFRRAMREGIDREGNFLYPAFPYDHFTKITDEDNKAIYAYLATRKPVRVDRTRNELSFPFNIRMLMAGWNLLFFKPAVFQPDPAKDEQWNRGAYLVQGLGHCGSCHSPRNLLGAEKSDQDLGGGAAEGWHAPALNVASPAPVPWTTDALVNYLLDGWDEHHGIAAGPMTGVVNKLADLAEEDIKAMAVYLRSLQGRPTDESQVKGKVASARQRDLSLTKSANAATPTATKLERGEAVFARACVNCHRAGTVSATQPVPLGVTTSVSAPDPRNVIRIIVEGIRPPKGVPERSMPAFSSLSDDDIADLVTFMRARFSEQPAWNDVSLQIREVRRSAH